MVTNNTPDPDPDAPATSDETGDPAQSAGPEEFLPPEADMASSAEPAPSSTHRFPIVGIGASAGGLAAFEAFFSAIPSDVETGMAFVLVQHLAPDHKSILTELVKRYTCMRVQEVEDGMVVEPDCAYIIPPNLDMALFNGVLHLLEPTAPHGFRLPIDFFFRSLAQDQHERAICVVLSGTGSDGTLGARAIKGEGGMVMVQAPKTAAYDGMPRSVIATGLTDFVLPPAEMPAQLMTYVTHAFGRRPTSGTASGKSEDELTKICLLLRNTTSHDFSQYKQSTLVRRIERRMALHQLDRQSDYVRYLRQDPAEIDALFHDLLIGVTSFFRDPEAFIALQKEVIPSLFAGKPAGAVVRVWSCGCSTGEEAYSIAMLLLEHLETLKKTFRVQVFATDVDSRAIEKARSGLYPISIAADVSPERLGRYFSQEPDGEGYRIQKVVRDLLVFSEQDLIKDPPFSRLDLISCRNLLIYFNGELQKRLIPLFHYALNPDGVLFLGNSESVGESLSLFSFLNRKWKLYIRREYLRSLFAPGLTDFRPPAQTVGAAPSDVSAQERRKRKPDLRRLTEQALLRHFDPVAVLTTGSGELLHIIGRTGQYLELPAGDAGMNILDMARHGLHRALPMALRQAVASKQVIQIPGLRVRTDGDVIGVDLTVRPVSTEAFGDIPSDLYLVAFDSVPVAESEVIAATAGGDAPAGSARDARIAELELELRAKEEYLQTTLEEMATANEELKSTNEEMQSVNEELQSTNEELETSKEELQSVNEELATVNAELQTKVADLSRANNDMNNLLAGTGVATLFVDHQLRITRFTPTATQLIKLITSDIGRSVGDIVSNLVDYTDFMEDVQTVLKSLVPHEQEVHTQQGAWYLMRMGPYRTLDNVIEGAVITFVDISGRKHSEDAVRASRALAEGVVDAVREPLIVLDQNLRLISANRAFYRYFRVSQAEIIGERLFELGDRQWDIPALRHRLLELQSTGASFDDFPVDHDIPGIGSRSLRLNARRLDPGADQSGMILLAIDDVTDRVAFTDPSAPASPEGGHDRSAE
jgi:two-component system, chemotaxis family, CheB/CheR fusion protein